MQDPLAPVVTNHVFHYRTDKPVTARALADSLLGLEAVILEVKPVVNCLLGAQHITDIQIFITGIEVGSYKDNFLVRMFFGEGKALERNIERVRKRMNLDKLPPERIIGIALALGIAWVAWNYLKPGDPNRIVIENSFNQIAVGTNVTGEDLRTLLETILSPTRRANLNKQVSRLVHPSGVAHTGSIEIDNEPNLTIPGEAISAVPVQSKAAVIEDEFAELNNVQMTVRAVDLDSADKGWWGIVSTVSENRVRLHVLPTVDPNRVPVGKYFNADITVTYSIDRNGTRKPRHYILSKVYGED